MDTDRAYITKAVKGYKSKLHPGLPITHLPLVVAPTLRAMLADGTLREVAVTKPSKTDPSRTMTYRYLQLAD